MTSLWPHKPHTFRALKTTFGRMWVRCDSCRRYAPLKLAGLLDVDYRSKTFSCSRCGSEATNCVTEPTRETGMEDYRLDPLPDARHHPKAVRRLGRIDRREATAAPDGELPGRKIDLRR